MRDAGRDERGGLGGCSVLLSDMQTLGSLARVGAGQVLRGVWEESSGGLWGTHGVWLKR